MKILYYILILSIALCNCSISILCSFFTPEIPTHLHTFTSTIEEDIKPLNLYRECPTLLHKAVQLGDLTSVHSILEIIAHKEGNPFLLTTYINKKTKQGYTPLHQAALNGNPLIVAQLIKYGARLDSRDKRDRTPLHLAVVSGNILTVALLLKAIKYYCSQPNVSQKEYQRWVNAREKASCTPFHYVAYHGHTHLIKLLLKYGANSNARNAHNETAHDIATTQGYYTIVTLIHYYHNPDAYITENNNEKHGLSQQTALMLACCFNQKALVKALLKKGVSLNIKDTLGRTALIWACLCNHSTIVSILLNHGAFVNIKDNLGRTALHYAAYYGYDMVIDQLCTYNASVCVKDNSHHTALLYAIRSGKIQTIIRLLHYGSFITTIDVKEAIDTQEWSLACKLLIRKITDRDLF